MKFFLDTANLDHIRAGAETGIVDGVTTNPSLIAKEGRDIKDVIREICGIVDGPISAEVVAVDYAEMVREAEEIAAWHDNVVVKVPMTRNGVRTVTALAPKGVRFNVTLCFSVGQALLAAKAGAAFVSPFVGRLDDINTRGIDIIPDIVQVFENYGYDTEVLVASVRNPLHVTEAALAGAHVATLPFKVFNQLFNHPLTDLGLAKFLADHRNAAQG